MGWDQVGPAVFIFCLAVLLELAALRLMLPMLAGGGAVRENFRRIQIPVAGGLTFPVTVLFCYIAFKLSAMGGERYSLYLTAFLGMALLGFVDDMLGQRDALGFKGHFSRLLRRGKLTTGALKALGGGIIAIYVSLFCSPTLGEFVVNVLLIALFTNSMNLFDLRPGRCVKAFMSAFIPLLFFMGADCLIFLPLGGAVLAYFPYDLKARVMMGDTGSNVLGLTLGIMTVYGLGLPARVVILALLILLHLYTERFSLTKTIEGHRFLSWLDRLGRSDSDYGKQG